MGGAGMDDISRGIATAAIALQSAMLQALVRKGVFTLEEALEVVDKGLDAFVPGAEDADAAAVAWAAQTCLDGVREGLAGMAAERSGPSRRRRCQHQAVAGHHLHHLARAGAARRADDLGDIAEILGADVGRENRRARGPGDHGDC